ncbi:MAG: response regulator, partial [Butyrivibrio sp.]|nr:response regulator [Butyrivibrio sp.]
MLKVFLVEDESVVRESLRDNIPWKEYGFSFVGEASDGEVALPLIRKTAPDVLITDIKMPFMDGLSLSHIVKKEFPSMRIVIMSGYDDFEYAKRAIKEGVDQYISKPITKSGMKEVLDSVKEKIEKERTQQGYLMQYQMETQEYEQLQRREFFEKVLTGTMPVKDIYVEAGKLSLDITASAFSLILFSIKDKEKPFEEIGSVQYCRALEELMSYFLRFPAYILSRWSLNTYIVIVKGEKDIVADYVEKGVSKITEICEDKDDKIEWYVSAGKPVERFSALVKCFNQVNHAFACRYFVQDTHILTEET